jgi:outer membrane protein OmpA-like peptidoglycan-associated protein
MALASDERSDLLLTARTTETRRALEQARQQQAAAEQSYRQAEELRQTAELALKEARMQAVEAEKASKQAAEAEAEAMRLGQQMSELQACRSKRGLVITLDDVLFEPGKNELATGAAPAIEQLAAYLNENTTRRVQLEGFSDNVGDSQYNLDLSIQRAVSVRDALNAAGVALERILIEGYGEEFPVASNDTADGKRRNRRVEAVISDEQGVIPDRNR